MNKKSTTLWLDRELLEATDGTLEMLENELGYRLHRHAIMKKIVEEGLERFNDSAHAQLPSLVGTKCS